MLARVTELLVLEEVVLPDSRLLVEEMAVIFARFEIGPVEAQRPAATPVIPPDLDDSETLLNR